MRKISDKHKSIFWHIHKTGGSYVEYILDRYYDFDIKWEELKENKEIEQKLVVVENYETDEDFMVKLNELEVYLENEKKNTLKLQEKHKNIKLAIELIKTDIDWNKKYVLVPDDKTNIETLSNYEEFELDINNEKIKILLCDKKLWNKLEAHHKGILEIIVDETTHKIKVPLEKWKTYFKFCVVRNPYDRAISSYEFLKQRDKDARLHPFLEKEECDFKYLFTHEEELSHNAFMHSHAYSSQVLNMKDNLHGINMDYIAKYENLEEEIVHILQQMGITEFPHLQLVKDNIKINKTNKKNFETYFDQEILQIINEKFKEDFETFGYKMYTNVQELNEHLLELNNDELQNKKRIDLLHKYYDENKLTEHSAFIDNFLLEQAMTKFKFKK